jgi:hypothetical protein
MDSRAEDAVAAYPLFQEDRGGAIPTSALQLLIEPIGARLACELNRQWHSMLPRTDLGNILCGNMTACFAAGFDGQWYAVAIWSQPIIRAIDDGSTLELRRLAICSAAPRFTASRMLSVMRKAIKRSTPEITRLVSYLAVDVHQGTIYKASGWKPVGEIVAARPQRFTGSHERSTGPLQTTSRKQRWELMV